MPSTPAAKLCTLDAAAIRAPTATYVPSNLRRPVSHRPWPGDHPPACPGIPHPKQLAAKLGTDAYSRVDLSPIVSYIRYIGKQFTAYRQEARAR